MLHEQRTVAAGTGRLSPAALFSCLPHGSIAVPPCSVALRLVARTFLPCRAVPRNVCGTRPCGDKTIASAASHLITAGSFPAVVPPFSVALCLAARTFPAVLSGSPQRLRDSSLRGQETTASAASHLITAGSFPAVVPPCSWHFVSPPEPSCRAERFPATFAGLVLTGTGNNHFCGFASYNCRFFSNRRPAVSRFISACCRQHRNRCPPVCGNAFARRSASLLSCGISLLTPFPFLLPCRCVSCCSPASAHRAGTVFRGRLRYVHSGDRLSPAAVFVAVNTALCRRTSVSGGLRFRRSSGSLPG